VWTKGEISSYLARNIWAGSNSVRKHEGGRESPITHEGWRESPITHEGWREPPITHESWREPPITYEGKREPPITHEGWREPPITHEGCPIHTTPQKIKNAALFVFFNLPTTRSFSKTFFKLEELWKRRLFEDHGVTVIITWFPWQSFPQFNTNPKWPGIVTFLNSSGVFSEFSEWRFRF